MASKDGPSRRGLPQEPNLQQEHARGNRPTSAPHTLQDLGPVLNMHHPHCFKRATKALK